MRTLPTLLLISAAGLQAQPTTPMPVTGREVPSLLPYETAVKQVLEKWSIPGAVLAIADGSRLIYVRGLGYADQEAREPVLPTSRFRLASISKTFTGMTILKLAEEGRINLDAPFMSYIPGLDPITTPPPDPRMAQITVRQLLRHTGGFDRPISDDHAVYLNTASRLFNEPVSPDLITRYIISQKLDFAPGTKFAYGNSGYQILGRVIEKVTAKRFMEAIYDKLLNAAGVTSVEPGGNLLSQRLPDEVKYYDYPGAPLTTSAVAPGVTLPAPKPYNWRVDMADSYGGLVANAIDLMRFLLALEGRRGPALLNQASLTAMAARPVPAVHPATGNYTGLTWRFIPTTGGQHWWHSGSAPGTRNLLVRRHNGRSWVILTNSRPEDEDPIITDLFNEMARAESQVKAWPAHDLFQDYSGPALSTSAQSLAFTHSEGSRPPDAQRLQVTASVNAAAVAVDPPAALWLRVDRLAGPAPLTLLVSVDPAGLATGEYQGQLRITTPNAANGPRVVRVSLRVNPAPRFTGIRNSASWLSTRTAAPDSRLTLEAAELAESTPEGLAARLIDSGGAEHAIAIARFAAQSLDLVVPAEAAMGEAVVEIVSAAGRLIRDRIEITAASPGLFSANGDGKGAAHAEVVRPGEDGSPVASPAFQCGDAPGSCTPVEIDLGEDPASVSLRLRATGIRLFTDPAALAVKIGDENAEVLAIEPGAAGPGVDLVTVRIPAALAGRGEADVTLAAGEVLSNAVKVHLK